MDGLCDSLLSAVLLHAAVPAADRGLLRAVCRRFRSVVVAEAGAELRDPRRRRVLDAVLDRAISGGGLASVRFLWGRPSCVWANAEVRAAARGDLEMVRFVRCEYEYDADYNIGCLAAALAGRHVDVAELLWSRRCKTDEIGRCGIQRLLLASSKSGSRAMLEWTVARSPAMARAAMSDPWVAKRMLGQACRAGDVELVRSICDATASASAGASAGAGASAAWEIGDVFPLSIPLSTDADVLRFLRGRFGYVPAPRAVASSARNHGALAYLLETGGDRVLAELLGVPAHLSPDLHAFLRSAGHRVDVDLATTAVAVAAAARQHHPVGPMEALMALRPDPAEWVAELGPMLRLVLETSQMQASFAKFFHGHFLDFEITASVPPDTFDALRAMGGRCGYRTFLAAASAPDSRVEHARAVWAAMADDDRRQFRFRADDGIFGWMTDVDMLKFMLEQQQQQPGSKILPYGLLSSPTSSRCFTPDLARFVLEHKLDTPAAVLAQAATLGHLDVVELVAPACTLAELRCLASPPPSKAARALIKRSILERTHPMLRWLAWLEIRFSGAT
jgi:hypothetical protein